jgi:glycine betaine/proline transport system substrate-binding protein
VAAAAIGLVLSACSPAISPIPSRGSPVASSPFGSSASSVGPSSGAVATASAPVGAASAPVASASAVAGGAPCGTVTIGVTPWPGAEADAAVVGYLLAHRLGCTVVKRQLDDESAWQFLASRGIDVILENWDHEDLATKYITVDQVAQDAGPSGNEGVIGWFAPRFFVDANPDILTAKTNPSILNTYADQFKTTASGQKGQLLDGEPGFVTEDEAMINGFGLNYTVVYAGSEDAANEAIQSAIAQHKPILAYHVMPSWFDTKVDLVHIALPPFTPGCNKDPDKVACDYPVYHLNKVVSTKFATSGSPGYELVKRFHWTNEDQNLVAASIVDQHLSDDAAALKWLDANPAVWRTWLP